MGREELSILRLLKRQANDACGGSDDDKRSEKDKLLCSVDVLL